MTPNLSILNPVVLAATRQIVGQTLYHHAKAALGRNRVLRQKDVGVVFPVPTGDVRDHEGIGGIALRVASYRRSRADSSPATSVIVRSPPSRHRPFVASYTPHLVRPRRTDIIIPRYRPLPRRSLLFQNYVLIIKQYQRHHSRYCFILILN